MNLHLPTLRTRARHLVARVKAAVAPTDVSPLVSSTGHGSWTSLFTETFAGAWQRGATIAGRDSILAFSPIYGAVDLIARDISKLRIKLVEFKDGVWQETTNPLFSPVLLEPNSYQTRIQFLSAWMVSKLTWGNAYILKQRDARNVVVALHVLDPRMVRVQITSDGGIYYHLSNDYLARTGGPVAVPQSEMIHDRALCLFHPLVGVGPLYAAALSASQGRHIQNNSSVFFENMSRPGGHLTADADIPDETVTRLKKTFEAEFSGQNMGRLLVTGSGLKYEALSWPAEQTQLIEQLGWTAEDCARPFHVPLYKLGLGDPPTFNNIGALNQDYYSQCLQEHIESIELLLDKALGLTGTKLGTELDLDALLRMDPMTRADVAQKLMTAGALSPDRVRQMENEPPLPEGAGKVPFMQHQMYPVTLLAKRTDVMPSTPAPLAPAPAPAPAGRSTQVNVQRSTEFRIKRIENLLVTIAENTEQGPIVRSLLDSGVPDDEVVPGTGASLEEVGELMRSMRRAIDAQSTRARHEDRP